MLTTVYTRADEDARLLRLREVAGRLGVSPRQVERVSAAGGMPGPVRIGRARRWRADEIDAWLRAGCPAMDAWSWPSGDGTGAGDSGLTTD